MLRPSTSSSDPEMTPMSNFSTFHPLALALLLLPSFLVHLPVNAFTAFDHWVYEVTEEYESLQLETDDGAAITLSEGLRVAEQRRRIITVRKDGSGNFRTVTAAVQSIPAGNTQRTIIDIGPGIYWEKLTVEHSKPYVTFYGDRNSMPTIVHDGTAATYGTWNSATVVVESQFFMACNIIFQNSAPMPRMGDANKQAVALRISGDMAAFYGCRFYGYQDTLCDDTGKHFFKDCFIKGTVDFIFGDGRSFYTNCDIQSVAPSTGITAIVAQGRQQGSQGGFSFVHCKIFGSGKAYLNRAWKDSSRAVFANSYMSSVVVPPGWNDFGIPSRDRTVFYGEYNNSGPGAYTGQRVKYARQLTEAEAQAFLSPSFVRAGAWLLPPPRL